MWLRDLFFGRRKTSEAPASSDLVVPDSFEDRHLTLSDPRWFGACSKSPDGRWSISWSDSDPSGRRGGYRESGEGAYLLYDNMKRRVVLRGRLERPNDGHVANNGTFSLEDWHFGGELSGTLYVIRPDGMVAIRRRLKANIFNSAISPNGRYAMCQTANSPDEDGGSVFLFDVDSGEQLFSVAPQGAWAQRYSIEEEPVRLVAHIQGLGAFRYDQDGNFLDGEQLEQAILEKGDYSICLLTVERALKEEGASQNRIHRLLAAVRRVRSSGADDDPRWKPLAMKLQGIAHELLGEPDAAIHVYTQALALDPKIGVKRRLAALQKAQK